MSKLVRLPEIINADYLIHVGSQTTKQGADGHWYAARPLSYQLRGPLAWWRRLKIAYGVFVGGYDALQWTGDQR